MKTFEGYLQVLREKANGPVECVGNCDLDDPKKECDMCIARRALNHAYDVLRYAYEDLKTKND